MKAAIMLLLVTGTVLYTLGLAGLSDWFQVR
jgi:hypothetical protein